MTYCIQEEIAHIKGHPKKLIIFLHGYIDNAENVEKDIQLMIDNLDDIAIHIPEAPHICEIHDSKRQWYSMHRFDPNDDRKTVPTIHDSAEIYNKMALGFEETSLYLDRYIEQTLNEYGLDSSDLFLCGYSQGAFLAIYDSLLRDNKIAGCISFGGIIAPYKYLVKNYQNTPNFLLIHGDEDNLVRFEAMEFTKKQLEAIGAKVETLVIKGGNHRITEEGVKKAIQFIKKHSK